MKLRIFLLLLLGSSFFAHAQEPKLTEDWSKKPLVINPGKRYRAPSDAIILYRHQKDLNNWQQQSGKPAVWKAGLCGLTANRTGSI
ncbi:MAG: hypothetical protein J7L96_01230, partial [Bacteroidales bacterium]|nr:hypothetical protein [Bacteroidales bacterium]